ncbi:MAG TPA: dihydroneopterin aldolase family protein [Methanoregulaceae archaeon]|nr:MAG: dihydroneopterin aldolase family protein [Methanolinea sp.]HON81305.1 dihydroneopterin aldolase family protein [Methanoregulaceae archaeon]HPD09831.1 dihydroneopterin aldolase family protein [Methanoregulaceae archaeon]HRT14448.1 dihydroneopterin aldolase family protein [Methanoregulaceae archaeon]HRU30019.1 dihydroneopterin aldolase family protein [Methanoregulaceae archaeon]
MTGTREQAIFEAGIKLGALYHQFVGTPVSPDTAISLETAIRESISLQPFVREVRVSIDRAMKRNEFGYSELKGTMISADVVTKVQRSCCHARLSKKGEYPMMEIIRCYEEP